jgi:hypothetical protein
MRARDGRPAIVVKADLLDEVSAIVRRVLKRPDFRLEAGGRLSNRQVMALLEALQALEGRRWQSTR